MPETDILNETPAWDPDLNDSIGPDFGWSMLRRSQLAVVKPAFGQPYSRTIGNGGHTGTFSWLNRSLACIEKLRRFAEEHEAGFFTIIDHDGGCRHYVGNFVGDMPYTQAGNDRYNVQGWTFEEIPGVPMLQYPDQWDRWAVSEYPFDDYGNQRTASTGWAPAPVNGSSRMQLGNDGTVPGTWATHEYRGYGCRLWARSGPNEGIVTLTLDGGAPLQLDLYNPVEQGIVVVFEQPQIPLNIHRFTITMTGTKNAESAGPGMTWDHLEVMR